MGKAEVVMQGNGASLAIDLVKLEEPTKDAGFAVLHAVCERERPLMASARLLAPLPAIVPARRRPQWVGEIR